MRGDASRQLRGGGGGGGGGGEEGRSSPNVVYSNGVPPSQHPQQQQHMSATSPSGDSSFKPPGINGLNSSNPRGRTSSFSYSSILALAPTASPQSNSAADGQSGNGSTASHDRPFKYSRDEMLNIWKSNAVKYKSTGLPLEFERHDAFTSEEPLDPALLTEMTPAEKEVCAEEGKC